MRVELGEPVVADVVDSDVRAQAHGHLRGVQAGDAAAKDGSGNLLDLAIKAIRARVGHDFHLQMKISATEHNNALLLLKLQGDAKLIAMARSGNPSAFETIVDRYQGRLLGFGPTHPVSK